MCSPETVEALFIAYQVTIVIINPDEKSSSQLRNTVDSKVGVMSRYSMLMMLIVGKLTRWRLFSWFDFHLSLSYVKYTYDASFLERDSEVSSLALL